MCQYHTWFRDERMGFVIECNQCHKIQVAFGMMMASFKEDEFHKFRFYIHSRFGDEYPEGNVYDKTIALYTPCESLSLLFLLYPRAKRFEWYA